MADQNRENVGVGISVEVLGTLITAVSTSNVRCAIYQRSTGYYWNGTTFASGKTYTAMLNTVGHIWRCVYTPNVATSYLIEIELEGTVVDSRYHFAQGGVTSAGTGTGYNLSQLRTLVKRMSTNNTSDDSVLDDLINLAILDIGSEEEGHWRYLEDNDTLTTVALQTTPYSLGSTVNELLDMRIIDPNKQKLIHYPGGWQNFIRDYPEHVQTGTPIWYIPYGIDASGLYQVYFHLWPSTSMTVYYEFYKKIGLLSADGDVPEIPQMFQQVIVHRAAYLGAIQHLKDQGLATLMLAMYEKGIKKMKDWNRNMLDQSADIPRHGQGYDLEMGTTSDSDYTAVSY